jgi:hypothetical protein
MIRTREVRLVDWNNVRDLSKDQRAKVLSDPGSMVLMAGPSFDPSEPPLSPQLAASISRALSLGGVRSLSFN